MSFYVSCRDQTKGVRQKSREARERHERKKEYFDDKRGDPLQLLHVRGRSARTYVDGVVHRANESGTQLVPWSGRADCLVDRFDVRSMLDVLTDYDGRHDEPEEDEEKQREGLLNYERYRALVESHRLGIDEESWLRRVERDVAVRHAAMEQLAGRMETARSVDDLRTPEERAQERALLLQGQLGPNGSSGDGGLPPGMGIGSRPNAKAGNASIAFNYGTGVVSDAQLAAEREADMERLRRVYEDAAAAEGEGQSDNDDEGEEEGSDDSDDDSDGDSHDEGDDHSAADPSDSLDTSALPVVLSIDAVEMLARGYGVLHYDTLHEHNAGIEARRQLKRLQRAHAHALRRVAGGRAPKGRKLNKRARRRVREKMMQEMARQAMDKMRARREEERALGGGGSAAPASTRQSSFASASASRSRGKDERDRHERKRRRSRSRSRSGSDSSSSDVEQSGRHFITSFPMPSASARAPVGVAASTRNSTFDVDRGAVEDTPRQGATESGFFLLPAPRAMIDEFFSDLAPVNARDETMRRLDGDVERCEEFAAQQSLHGGSAFTLDKKHWAPRRKRTSRSSSPDSPRHARVPAHAAGSRSGASASATGASASARPALPAAAASASAPAKLTGAALLKSRLKNQLNHLVQQEDESNRRRRREEALHQRETQEQLEQQRRQMHRERDAAGEAERGHSQPQPHPPPPGMRPPPGLEPRSPTHATRRSRSRSRSHSRSRSPSHRRRPGAHLHPRTHAHSHSGSHSHSSRHSPSRRSRSRSLPSRRRSEHRDPHRSRSRSRDSHRHARRHRSRSRSPRRSHHHTSSSSASRRPHHRQ